MEKQNDGSLILGGPKDPDQARKMQKFMARFRQSNDNLLAPSEKGDRPRSQLIEKTDSDGRIKKVLRIKRSSALGRSALRQD